MEKRNYYSIDKYIESFPDNIKAILIKIRETIKSTAPNALEIISYQMPAFKLNGILVYFAANKKHIGFYPTSSGITAFENEINEYKHSKGAIQFPLDKPIPYDLIKRIVLFRVKENLKAI